MVRCEHPSHLGNRNKATGLIYHHVVNGRYIEVCGSCKNMFIHKSSIGGVKLPIAGLTRKKWNPPKKYGITKQFAKPHLTQV